MTDIAVLLCHGVQSSWSPRSKHGWSALPEHSFRRAAFYIDLLEERGPELGEPQSRQLSGKLRELRFSVGGRPMRLTYFIREERRIVLLTVFAKRRRRERSETERALRAMAHCRVEEHDVREGGA